ncbi:MAG TPA: hypothetical protein VGA63_10535 [Geopsychrobacteraceae bacterium]|jgi:hypothetical protein
MPDGNPEREKAERQAHALLDLPQGVRPDYFLKVEEKRIFFDFGKAGRGLVLFMSIILGLAFGGRTPYQQYEEDQPWQRQMTQQ